MRSWKSRTAKIVRPAAVPSRLRFGKHRDHDRRGRQGQGQPNDGSRNRRFVQKQGDTAERRR